MSPVILDTGKADAMLRKFYSKLEKESKPVIEKPFVQKYKSSELRNISKALEILDINGGDVDGFLDAIHADKDKFNHLRLQPA